MNLEVDFLKILQNQLKVRELYLLKKSTNSVRRKARDINDVVYPLT
jgi:hypothetical protein